MNNNRAGYSFVALGFAALAAGIACLGWADSLGGYRFIGATSAIFLALLSFSRFFALHRPPMGVRAIPMPERMYESVRAPIMPSHEAEDAELAAKLAALRAPRRQPDEPRFAAHEPDPFVEVIEGPPLEPEPASPVEVHSVEPLSSQVATSSGLRQMDELRAEIARLREGARKRQTVGGAAVGAAPPSVPEKDTGDQFARTEFSGLPGESAAAPSEDGEVFPRTEFSGLAAPSSREASFTKTEYLVPIELRR